MRPRDGVDLTEHGKSFVERWELEYGKLITIHCSSHITALGGKWTVMASELAQDTEKALKSILADFADSPIQHETLKQIYAMLDQERNNFLRLKSWKDIRWTTRDESVKRILRALDSLFVYYGLGNKDPLRADAPLRLQSRSNQYAS